MTFAQKIKELRTEKNWKQETLAKEIGTDVRQVSLYENDKTSPSIETVVKIAQTFNVSIDYLLIEDYPRRPLILNDNSVIDKIQNIELLTQEEKDAIYRIIDGLAYKNKLKSVISEVQ
ncbi:MAG: hypothetical protein A2Z98_15760 [Spirochaetes bacterium GWB1_27_13]|nr:MAG: hypothetical protein A2Z98_15760 [Spirochaetes bacterium GWB1_27_13]